MSSETIWKALKSKVPNLEPLDAAAPTGEFPPWSTRYGWASYLVDLGTWEDLLRDFEKPLAYVQIRRDERDLQVRLTDGEVTRLLTRPLDGTGFTGATPAELAADFFNPR